MNDAVTTLTVDFDAEITSGENSSETYVINGDSYAAENATLTIAATAEGSTLTEGTVKLTAADNATKEVELTGGDVISATGTDANEGLIVEVSGGAWAKVSDIDSGESFTITTPAESTDEEDTVVTYEKTAAGLFKTVGSDITVVDATVTEVTPDDEDGTAVKTLDTDSVITIADNTVETVYVNSDKSARVASYDGTTITAATETADGVAMLENDVTLEKDGVSFSGDFSAAEITRQIAATDDTEAEVIAKFAVSDSDTNFTVTDTTATINTKAADSATFSDTTKAAVSIDGAKDITLTSGTLTVDAATQTIYAGAVANGIKLTDTEVANYVISYDGNIVELDNINKSATVELVGISGSTVTTGNLANAETVYKFQTQEFTVAGDNDGLKFTLNDAGYVTEIEGLDINATLKIVDESATLTAITVNNTVIDDLDTTAKGTTLLGAKADVSEENPDGLKAATMTESSFYAVIDSDGLKVYAVNSETKVIDYNNIVTEQFRDVDKSTSDTIVLAEGVAPTNDFTITIVNKTENAVSVVSNDGDKTYLSGLTGNGDDSVTVRIVNEALELVTIDADTQEIKLNESDEITVSGTVEIPANGTNITLTVKDGFTITSSDTAVVGFDSDNTITLQDAALVVAGAPEGVSFVLDGSAEFTVNDEKFSAVTEATVKVDENDVPKLFAGTVQLDGQNDTEVELYNGAKVATENEIYVNAAEGDFTGVEALKVGESFTLTNTVTVTGDDDTETEEEVEVTYTMYELGLFADDVDGALKYLATSEEEGGALVENADVEDEYIYIATEFDDASGVWATAIVTDENTIDLTDEAVTGDIVFVNNDRNAVVANLTFDAETVPAEYTLAKADGLGDAVEITLPANGVLTTDFAATVEVAGDATVNGVAFDAATTGEGETATESALTIAATSDTATLTAGQVVVTVDNSLAITGVEKALTVTTDEDGVTVTVAETETEGVSEAISITGLNAGGKVEYDGVTYTMVEDRLAVKDANGITIYDNSDETTDLLALDAETGIAYVQIENAIALTSETAVSTIYGTTAEYASESAVAFATKTTTESDTSFALTAEANISALEEGIALNVEDASVTTDFTAQITTIGTATVNGTTFTAAENGLTIDTVVTPGEGDDEGSTVTTLTTGKVTVTDSLAITGVEKALTVEDDSDGVTITVAETETEGVSEATSITGLNAGGKVEYDGVTYSMVATRLAVNDGTNITIYNDSSEATDLLAPEGDEISYVQVEDKVITLAADDAAAVIYGTTAEYESATAIAYVEKAENAFALTAEAGISELAEIDLEVEGASVTTDFAATIEAVGTATVNDATFTMSEDGEGLTIAATYEDDTAGATLTEGVVVVTDSLDTTGAQEITDVTAENGIIVTVENGAITNIADIDSGETFTLDGVTYEATDAGLFKTETDGDGNSTQYILSTGLDQDSINFNTITDADWTEIYTLNEGDTTLDLKGVENSVEVLTNDKSTRVATIEYNSETATYDVTKLESYTAVIETVTLGASDTTLTTNFATTATTESGTGTYVINGTTLVAQESALEMEVDTESVELINGTVAIKAETDAASVQPSGESETAVTATSGNFNVTVENGVATTIANIETGETFTIGGNEYVVSAIGLITQEGTKLVDSSAGLETISVDALESLSTIEEAPESTITITASTFGESETSIAFVDAADSTASKIYATFDGETLTAAVNVADIAKVVLENIEITFGENFANIEITSGDTTFEVTSTDEFTVSDTTVSAAEITLKAGTLTAVTTEQTVTVDGGAISVSESEVESYDIAVAEAEGNVTVEVTGINTSATISIKEGLGGSTVDTTDLAGATVTYKFNEQEFTVSGDNSEGIIFTVDDNGDVTNIDGLDADATLVTNSAVTVNGVEFELGEGGVSNIVGTQEGTSASRIYEGGSVVIDFNGSEVKVYAVSDEGDIDYDELDYQLDPEEFVTYANGVITLKESIVPSADTKVIITSSSPVSITSASTAPYINEFSTATNYVGVQISDNGALTLVSTAGYELSDATENTVEGLNGTITLPANASLTLYDGYTITAGETEGAVTFAANTITLDGNGLTVAGAPEDTTFVFAAATEETDDGETTYASYKVNDQSYAVVADATFVVNSEGAILLNAGQVVVDAESPVETVYGDTLSYESTDENADGVIANASGTSGAIVNVQDIEVGESFTLNNVTYTMEEVGLTRGENEIWVDSSTAASDTFTKADLAVEANWIGYITAEEGALVINSEIDATGDLLIVDAALTTRYGTLTQSGETYTISKEIMENVDATEELASITIEGAVVNFADIFAAPVTAGNATFTVDSTFTVDATGEVAAISETEAVTLENGTISVADGIAVTANEAVVTIEGGYTISLENGTVSVTDTSATTYDVAGGTAFVTTENLNNATVTYTIGNQTFTVAGDTDSGITFEITDNKVTAVTGLDINATLTITGTAGDTILINDEQYAATLNNEGTISVVGTGSANGENAIALLDGTSYQIVYSGNGAITLYEIDDQGNIVTNNPITSARQVGRYVTYGNGVLDISANAAWMPSESNIIVITNTSEESISLVKGDTVYADNISNLGENYGVQIVSANELQIVTANGTIALAETAPTSGTVGVAANVTLTIEDGLNVISTEDTVVEFGEDAITFDGAGITITGTGTFVLTAEESSTYTINETEMTVLSTANVTVTEETITLNSGALQITDSITVAAGTINVEGDSDGVAVVVDEEGNLTSITALSSGGKVTFDNTTYEMVNGKLTVTNEDGIKVYDADEETNILEPSGDTMAYVPVEEDGKLDLAKGVAELANADSIIYGTGSAYVEEEVVATLTGSEGAYVVSGADSDTALEIDASGVEDLASVTVDVAATVTTPATTDAVEVNGVSYTSAGDSLTIDAADDSSTLFEGTVTLAEGATVATTEGNEVTATTGEITATAAEGAVTEIGAIDTDDAFQIDSDTYIQNAAGLIRNDADGNTSLLEGSGETFVPAAENIWTDVITVDTEGNLDISEIATDAAVFDADVANKVASLTFDAENGAYILNSDTADAISTIQLGSETTTITVDFEVQVVTADGTESATVNNVTYVPTTGTLTIAATADGSTLYNGTAHLDSTSSDTNAVTISDTTITATGTEIDVTAENGAAVSVSDINVGETFTINEDTFEQTGIGLVKNGNELLVDSESENFTYALTTEDWTAIEVLDSTATIALTADTTPVTYVDSDMTVQVASYSDSTLTAITGESATAVTLAEGLEVKFAGFANGVTEITSGGATFAVIDGDEFTVSGATVDATALTLIEGTLEGVTAEQTIAINDGSAINIDAELDNGYTITRNENIVEITGINKAATVTLTGAAGSTVDTTDLDGETTYTFADGQAFTIADDAADGVQFTVDAAGHVVEIAGLDLNATIAITVGDSPVESITINGTEFTDTEDFTVIGDSESNESAVKVLTGSSFYIEVTNNGLLFTETNGSSLIGDATEQIAAEVTYENGVLTLPVNLVPSDDNIIIINNETAEEIQVVSASANVFVESLSGAVVRISKPGELKLVEVDGTTISDVANIANVSGTIGMTAGTTLTAGAITITTGTENEGTATFEDGTITLDGDLMTAEGAPEGTNFVFTAEGQDAVSYSVNGKAYEVLATATVGVTADGSTLTNGTVALDDTTVTTVDVEAGTITATATSANEDKMITVAVDEDGVTIGGIDAGDAFTVDDTAYTMTTVGMISNGAIWTNAGNAATLTELDTTNTETWSTMIAATEGTLDLATFEGTSATIVDSLTAPAAIYGTVEIDGDTITVNGAENNVISTIALGENGVTLTTDNIEANVTTTGTATYTINATTFDATSALTIAVTAESVTLSEGTVTVNESVTTTDGLTVDVSEGEVSVTAANGSVTSITGLGADETVVYNGNTYNFYDGVVAVTGDDGTTYYRAGQTTESNLLALEGEEIAYVQMTDGVDVNAGIEALDNATRVYYGETETYEGSHIVELTGASDTGYTLTAAETITDALTVNAGDAATLTVEFAANVTTALENFTLNGDAYANAGDALELATAGAANDTTVVNGTVQIENGADVRMHGTNGVYIKNSFEVKKGAETFTVGENSYTMTEVGMISNGAIWQDAGETVTLDELATEENWSTMFAATEGVLNLSEFNGETATIVDSVDAPAAVYGTLEKDGETYSVTGADDNAITEIQLGDSAATLTTEGIEANVTTTGNATYTVNDVQFVATAPLTINIADETTLFAGTVTVSENVTTTGNDTTESATVTVENGEVTVTAEGGSVTSITGLGEGEVVVYNDATYTFYASGVISVTNDDGTTYYAGQTTETNLLEITGDVVAYVSLGDELDINAGVEALTGNVTRVLYGESDEYEGSHLIEMTAATEGYELTVAQDAEIPEDLRINAGDVATLTVEFAATVATELGEFTLNGDTYTNAEGTLELYTAGVEGDTTVVSGIVTIENGASVEGSEASETSITATSGNFNVTFEEGVATEISGVENGETFTIGEISYTMAQAGLISNGAIWAEAAGEDTINLEDIATEDNWSTMIAATEGNLDISAFEGESATIVDNLEAPTAIYGTVEYADNAFTVTGADNNAITTITLGADDTTLTTEGIAANVVTTGESATYTVNEVQFVATAPLTINIAEETTLSEGTVTVAENVTTTDGLTVEVTNGEVSVTAANGSVTSITGLGEGEQVVYNDATYTFYASGVIGVTNDDVTTYYAGQNEETNLLDIQGDIVDYVQIDGSLDVNAGVEKLTGEVARILYGNDEIYSGTHIVELAATTEGYALTQAEGAEIPEEFTIDAGDVTVLTVEFAANVTTALGEFTLNGDSYTNAGENLELYTAGATEDTTVVNGVVTVAEGASVDGSSEESAAVAATTGTVNVEFVDGVATNISDIAEGETFTGDETAYTMTAAGLIKEGAILTGAAVEEGAISVENLVDDNFTAIVGAADGNLTISAETLAEGSALVVDDVTNPAAIYGTLTVADGVYTVSTEGADENAEFGTITVDGVVANFEGFESVSAAAGDAEFTVENAGALVIDATEEIATVGGVETVELTSGTISVPEGIAVTAGDNKVESITGGYIATVENGALTISDVTADGAEITVEGAANVVTANLEKATVSYTIGAQTFTFEGDANDGVTFEITDGKVSAIKGLDRNALLTIASTEEGYSVAVNNAGKEFTVGTEEELKLVGRHSTLKLTAKTQQFTQSKTA